MLPIVGAGNPERRGHAYRRRYARTSTRAEVDGHARESTPSSGRDQGRTNPKMGNSVAVLRPSLDSDDRPNGRLSLQARKSSHTSQARVGEKANLSFGLGEERNMRFDHYA